MEGEDGVEIFAGDEQDVVEHGDDLDSTDHGEGLVKEDYYDDGVELVGDEEIELEGEEEPYDIKDEDKDEEYVDEIVDDLDKEAVIGDAEKSGDGEKQDSMLVVDEWDNHDVDSLSNEEDQLKTEDGKELIDPEESEKLLLHMPPLKVIVGDLLHLRRNRRVSLFPVTYADLDSPLIRKYRESDICEEVKIQFVRSSDEKTWSGFLSFTFMTSKNATQAVESLKTIREDLTVKLDTNPDASLDAFIKNGKKTQASPAFWSDRLLIVRNITTDCKPEDLRAVFTEAEEIVVAKDSTTTSFRRRRGGSTFGYAYVLYETPEAAREAAETLTAQQVEFNKVLLDVHLYREPVTEIPRALLYLRRRRLILRHLEKLVRNVEKAQTDPEYKLAPATESRIALCKSIIEKDDKVRQELKLAAPTFEDFKTMKGFRPYSKQDAERVLISHGIIARPSVKPADSTPASHRDRPGNRRDQRGRGGHVDNRGGRGDRGERGDRGRGARGNFRRGGFQPRDRRSPPGNRRRNDWGGESRRGGYIGNGNSRQQGMNRQQSGGGVGMMNPLAMMMQQNLGGLLGASGLVNPSVLNPISMLMQQPGVSNLLGGSGSNPMSLMGGGAMEPPPKLMRLDETGNMRVKRDGRDFSGGMRVDHGMLRDNRGRQRSRSPDYHHMGPMRNQRGGGMRPPSQRSGFNNDADRLGPQNRAYESSGGPPRGGEDDLSLLMNLSKMLSHKMEQKRQADHGYH